MVLVSLANNAEILKVVFDKKELRRRKQRIEQIVNGEIMGRAAKEAIEAMQAAVMVAVMHTEDRPSPKRGPLNKGWWHPWALGLATD